MRQRFNYLILVFILGLVLGTGCSKPKAPEPVQPEPNSQTETVPATPPAETPAPVAETPAPAPAPEAMPAPVEPAPEKPEPSIWEKMHVTSPVPAVPAVPKVEALHVYYQKDPLPEAWLTAWTATSHVTVTQSKFSEGAALPADGDIYLFTPDILPQIMAGPGAMPLEENWARAGLDSAFTNQPFDMGNLHTRPFRWTPYLLYGLSSRKAPWKDKYVSVLMEDPKTLWPDHIGLLTGLTLKDQKLSANPRNSEVWIDLYRSIEKKMQGKTATEAECWSKLQAGEIEITLLPATCRLLLPAPTADAPGVALDVIAPPSGTLVYFEQLAIGAHTKNKGAALLLGEYLLKIDQQKRLLPETGYFSVRVKPKTEPEQGGLNLKKEWFEYSEFLTNAPVLAKEEVVPAAPIPTPVAEKDAAKIESAPAAEKNGTPGVPAPATTP